MSMKEIIEIERINKYGNNLLYPVNDQAKLVCKLVGGQKTLTTANVKHLKAMGFTVRQVVQVDDGKTVTVGEL